MKVIKLTSQKGFTILELMIATTILSVILLMATAVMINIGDLYYKGNVQAKIQDGTRSLTDQVSQDLEFSNYNSVPQAASENLGDFNPSYNGTYVYAFCMPTITYEFRYTYVNDLRLGSTATPDEIDHVVWRDQITPESQCKPADLTSANPDMTGTTNAGLTDSGTELVPDNSRLLKFCINSASFVYPATNPDPNCATPSSSGYTISVNMAYGEKDLLSALSPDAVCNGGYGDQFCATDKLSTIVTPRSN